MRILLLFLIFALPHSSQGESELHRNMKLGCDHSKLGRACFNYANLVDRKGDDEMAAKYFKKGCKLGHKDSCSETRKTELIHATFKQIKQKKIQKVTKIELEQLEKLSEDQSYMDIVSKYCDKSVKNACLMKRCLENLNQNSCSEIIKMTNEKMKQAFSEEYLKEYLNKEEFSKFKKVMQGISDLQKTKMSKTSSDTEKKEMLNKMNKLLKSSFEYHEMVSNRERKRLTKSCDSGSVNSCYDLELADYANRQIASLKELSKKMMD